MSKATLPIKIKDTRTNKLIPLSHNEKVNIYLCGPTVYDDLHIGNIRNIIVLDALVLLLKELDYEVNYVQNITDIDDKIIAKAKKLKITEPQLAEKFFQRYQKLLQDLQISPPVFIKVSEQIPEIIAFIEKLLKKGAAYKTAEGIYFDISKFSENYGIFKKLDLNRENSLASNDNEIKKQSEDFAL